MAGICRYLHYCYVLHTYAYVLVVLRMHKVLRAEQGKILEKRSTHCSVIKNRSALAHMAGDGKALESPHITLS